MKLFGGRHARARDSESMGSAEQDAASIGGDNLAESQSTQDARAPAATSGEPQRIEGERGIISVNRVQSLQSRVSSVLAIGLMSVLGLALLGWYYRQMLSRPARAQEGAQAAVKQRVQGEMPLPPLGEIHSAAPANSRVAAAPTGIEQLLGPAPEPLPVDDPTSWGTELASHSFPAGLTPEARSLERRLAGPVFTERGLQSAGSAPPKAQAAGQLPADTHIYERAAGPEGPNLTVLGEDRRGGSFSGELESRLRPSILSAVHAQILPTQRLLLPKGAFIDCTLETAIDSTLPGMTTCVMATDSFSADGKVVLLERGTKLVGETSAQVRQGATRVFVLWTQARTPSGVVVPLDSPGTDELGRAGLPGEVNRHFWERFGAAILVSVIDGAIQSAVQSSGDGGAVIVNPAGSQTVMTEVLKSTVNIPPTIVKHHGDRIQVLVARDLDFRSVYELRPAALR